VKPSPALGAPALLRSSCIGARLPRYAKRLPHVVDTGSSLRTAIGSAGVESAAGGDRTGFQETQRQREKHCEAEAHGRHRMTAQP
jgi:hypothetical protein